MPLVIYLSCYFFKGLWVTVEGVWEPLLQTFMPLVIYLSCFLMFMYCLGFNETLSEALPLVSLKQGDNSFFNGKLRIPLTRHPPPFTKR